MTEHLLGMLLVGIGMLLEAAGQICLKQAAERDLAGRGLGGFLLRLWRNRWIAAGVSCFIIEYGFYTAALRFLPVSIAFPAGSICFVFVAILSRIFLKERVGAGRWVGVVLILAGVAVLGVK